MPSYFQRSDFYMTATHDASSAVVRDLFFTELNGDGRLDAVATYQYYPLQDQPIAAQVLLGSASGGFVDGSATVFPGGAPSLTDARAHVAADFNGDGRTDLFLTDGGYETPPYPGAKNALYLSGAGGLTDASARLPDFIDYNVSASGGDIDGDGRTDILVTALGGTGAYFLVNDGTGGFIPDNSRLPAAIAPAAGHFDAALLFDANNDGRADAFLGGEGDSKILLNDGTGQFVIPSGMTYPMAGAHVTVDAAAADVNRDGLMDVVVTAATDNFTGARLQVLINYGDGIFIDETDSRLPDGGVVGDVASDTWTYRTQIADFNGDTAPDLLLSGGARDVILLNDGDGRFVPLPGAPGDLGPLDRATAADLNGDGRADILAWRSDSTAADHFSLYLSADPGPSQTGGAGTDGLMGASAADTLHGMGGDDVIFGGAGQDYLRGEDGADQIYGGFDFDNINGNTGDDLVRGGQGADWVLGGQGADRVFGDEDGDICNGNMGADTVNGGPGDDYVRGGQSGDVLMGGRGGDWLSGDLGDDTLTGGQDADTFHFGAGAGADVITDFKAAEGDRIQLDPGLTYTATQVGADTVVQLSSGDRVTLAGVQAAGLPDGWIFTA